MERNENASFMACMMVSIAALYYLYMFLIRVLPTVMTKDLMLGFQATGLEISLLMVSFVYAYAFAQIPAGILIDRYGAKKILIFGMLGCALSGYLFQMTNNLWVAILARTLMGLFSGPSFIAPMAMVKQHLPERLFTPAAGFIQVLGCVGAMLTQPAADLVTQIGWQETILCSALIAAILFLVYCLFPKDHASASHLESISTRKALAQIIRSGSFWYVGFLAMASWAAIGGFTEAWGISYLSVLQDISVVDATAQMNWAWLGVAISSPLAGFWFEHAEYKVIPLISSYAFGFVAIVGLISGKITDPHTISGLLLVLGASAGAQPIAFKLTSKVAPDNIHATAISFCNMCVIAGAFAVQPIVSQVLEFAWDGNIVDGIPYYQAGHFQTAFIPIAIVLLVAIIATPSITKLKRLP